MKQCAAIPIVLQPFMITFDDEIASQAVDGPICLFGVTTKNMHIIEGFFICILILTYY